MFCGLFPVTPTPTVCLSICLSVRRSVCSSVSQPVRLPVCLSPAQHTLTFHEFKNKTHPSVRVLCQPLPRTAKCIYFDVKKRKKKRGIGLSCANSCPHARCSITSWNNYTEGEGAGQDCRQNIQHANYFLPGWSLSPQQLWHLNHNLTTHVTVLTKRFFHGESLKKRMYLHYVRGVVSFQSQGQSFPVTN